MTSTLPCARVASVDEVIAQMTAIDAALPAGDGVSAFNYMYLTVTSAVRDAIADGFFVNSVFLDRLDVVFANHYFAALEAAQRGHSVPRCWQVLWQRRGHAEVAPLQFAVAGMNAHINHDLVLAVVETLAEFGTDAHDPTMHADFVRVNTLLGRLEGDIRRSFEHGFLLRLERHWGRLEDRVEGWSIAVARAAAWQDAEWLWRVRNHALARARYEQALDAAVALAGCCLLAPLRHAAELHGERCATQGPVLSGGV